MQRAGHLATSHTGLSRKSHATGRGIPPIGVLHAQHSLLVREFISVKDLAVVAQDSAQRHSWRAGIALAAAAAKAGVSISHNCVR